MARLLTLFIFVFIMAWATAAQQVQVAKPREASYVGDPVTIKVAVEGFKVKPSAVCEAGEAPQGVFIRAAGVNHQSNSYVRRQGNQFIRETQITYVFGFQITADKAGKFQIPPFTVTQGKQSLKTEPFEMTFKQAQLVDDMRIELSLPNQPIYPGQRVPVTVSWWYSGDLDNASDMNVRVPLFDRFEYVDEPIERRKDSTMTLHTNKGDIRLKAVVEKRKLGGDDWVVLSATRQMMVKEPGEYEIAAPVTSIRKVTKWSRDFFGNRPLRWVRQRAEGKAHKLIVKPLPLAQAPAGFAGAVGKWYGIEVAADRTVVQAGDPVRLTIILRGDGDLETASLPKLSGDHAMNPQKFRVPDGDIPGSITEQGKQFVITARVLDESVTEIPPIQYAWFNPVKQVFMTAQSDPIALRVTAGKMITAGDVVSAEKAANTSDPSQAPAVETNGSSARRFNLTGADLAIEPDVAKLLIDDRDRFGGENARAIIYMISVGLLGLAWMGRKAAQVDPVVTERRHLLRRETKQIAHATKLSKPQAAAQIAAALRQMSSCANTAQRGSMDQLIAKCDTITFAPESDDQALIDNEIINEAKQLAQQVARQSS